MTMTFELPEELAISLRDLAKNEGKDVNYLAITAISDLVNEAERRRDVHERLYGPAQIFDPEAIRKKHGMPSGQTSEEIEADWDEAIANLTPEQKAWAEESGII